MKSKNSKRRLAKKKIRRNENKKNKVNVERTFMREREIYLYWFKIHIMSLKTSTQLKKKKGNEMQKKKKNTSHLSLH